MSGDELDLAKRRINLALLANAFRTSGMPLDVVTVQVNDLVILLKAVTRPTPPPRPARRVYPKCADCRHSERSHNDLGYCQVGAGMPSRTCDCGGWDNGLRRQPDGSLA